MDQPIPSLHNYIRDLNEEYGGDITFIKKGNLESLSSFEKQISWRLPEVYRDFLLNLSNGLEIGNRRILGTFERSEKKTLVENLERHNDPAKSPWFKTRPHIFKDYVVIGSDIDICFCYSKRYDFPNPTIYICTSPNGTKGVDFESLDAGLEALIRQMVVNEFYG